MQTHHLFKFGLCILLTGFAGCIQIKPKNATPAELEGPDQGVLGDLHRQHTGQIVFAAQPIQKDSPADFPLQSKARLGDPVFGRAFFKQPMGRAIAELPDPRDNCRWDGRRNLALSVKVDGGTTYVVDSSNPGDKTWGFYTSIFLTDAEGALMPSKPLVLPMDAHTMEGNMARTLASLSDGEHRLEFTYNANCNAVPDLDVAKGELTLEVDAEGRDRVAKSFRLAEAGFRTQPEEVARLEAAAKLEIPGDMVHFRVIEPVWNVERGPQGEPLNRHVIATIVMREGDRCTVSFPEVREEAEGGGKFGAPVFLDRNREVTGDLSVTLPCSFDMQS